MPYKKVYKEIKKYDNIVIARHVGADPDALASSIALKESIKLTFPNKNVFVIGAPANRFSYLGTLDKLPEELNKELLIVTDEMKEEQANRLIKAINLRLQGYKYLEIALSLEIKETSVKKDFQTLKELWKEFNK